MMVGVYGPRQGDRRDSSLERGSISCDVKLASFATRERGKFGQSLEERELSATLLTALQGVVLVETFPKASLDVYCTILEAGGSEPAVTITAAVLAIIDAGVEVRDVLTACAVSKTKTLKSNGGMNETVLVLDPTNEEMDREQGGMLIAATGSGSLDVSQLVVWGPWEEGELKEGLELGLGGCAELHAAARQHLKESVLSSL